MNDTLLKSVNESIQKAQDSKDINRILDEISIGLSSNMHCSLEQGKRLDTIAVIVDDIKSAISDVINLDSRVRHLEAKMTAFIEQRRGASKAIKFILAAGLFGGGAVAGNLPAIAKAILSVLGE